MAAERRLRRGFHESLLHLAESGENAPQLVVAGRCDRPPSTFFYKKETLFDKATDHRGLCAAPADFGHGIGAGRHRHQQSTAGDETQRIKSQGGAYRSGFASYRNERGIHIHADARGDGHLACSAENAAFGHIVHGGRAGLNGRCRVGHDAEFIEELTGTCQLNRCQSRPMGH